MLNNAFVLVCVVALSALSACAVETFGEESYAVDGEEKVCYDAAGNIMPCPATETGFRTAHPASPETAAEKTIFSTIQSALLDDKPHIDSYQCFWVGSPGNALQVEDLPHNVTCQDSLGNLAGLETVYWVNGELLGTFYGV